MLQKCGLAKWKSYSGCYLLRCGVIQEYQMCRGNNTERKYQDEVQCKDVTRKVKLTPFGHTCLPYVRRTLIKTQLFGMVEEKRAKGKPNTRCIDDILVCMCSSDAEGTAPLNADMEQWKILVAHHNGPIWPTDKRTMETNNSFFVRWRRRVANVSHGEVRVVMLWWCDVVNVGALNDMKPVCTSNNDDIVLCCLWVVTSRPNTKQSARYRPRYPNVRHISKHHSAMVLAIGAAPLACMSCSGWSVQRALLSARGGWC